MLIELPLLLLLLLLESFLVAKAETELKIGSRKEGDGEEKEIGARGVGRLTSSAPGCCDWGWQENAGGFGRHQQPLLLSPILDSDNAECVSA